jgi:hypothetical protein
VQRLVPAAPTPQVHQLVAGDGQHPGADRQRGVVGAALQVQRQQGFLHQVLQIVGQALHAAAQIGAQPGGDAFQRLAVGMVVARLRTQPERLQAGFEVVLVGVVSHVVGRGGLVTAVRSPAGLIGAKSVRSRCRGAPARLCRPSAPLQRQGPL